MRGPALIGFSDHRLAFWCAGILEDACTQFICCGVLNRTDQTKLGSPTIVFRGFSRVRNNFRVYSRVSKTENEIRGFSRVFESEWGP